jgi:hypothetical protein
LGVRGTFHITGNHTGYRSTNHQKFSEAIFQPPDKNILKLHVRLHKAQSSILTQLRTGKIGLAAFLSKARVPGYTTATCASCEQGPESPRHVVVHCPRFNNKRRNIQGQGTINFRWHVTSQEGVGKVTKWWLRNEVVSQSD